MRRLACNVLLASMLLLAISASANAEGGASIAAAPALVVGQQEFGTLATPDAHCVYASWWLLPVIAGDTIQIDWEVHNEGVHLHIWPPGTNEFNFETRESLKLVPNTNLKTESTFQATQTGDMPMRFAVAEEHCPTVGVPGPYSFTAYVTHALNIALPHVAALHSKGTLTVAVHNPEGGVIDDPAVQVELQIDVHGSWDTIGVAAVANSAAMVHYKIPVRFRRQRVAMRAVAHGPEYKSTDSSHLKVRTL